MTDPRDLDAWARALADDLGVDPESIDVTAILDLARDAAHAVMRPAAPVAAYVAGMAAGLNGGTPAAGAESLLIAQALAARWAAE